MLSLSNCLCRNVHQSSECEKAGKDMKKQKGTCMLTNTETGHLASCDIQISKRENCFLLIHDMDLVGDL